MLIVTVAAVARASWLRWHRRLCHSSHSRLRKEKGIEATGRVCLVGWLGWLWESDFRRSSACWHPFAPLSTAHKAESQRGCQETRPGYGRDTAQEHRATSFDGRLACAICLGLFKCWIFLFLGERDGKTTCIWGTYRLAWAFVCRLPGEAKNNLHFERVKSWRLPSLKTNIAHENGWLNGLSSL